MLISGKRKSSLSECSANMASSLTVSLERFFEELYCSYYVGPTFLCDNFC